MFPLKFFPFAVVALALPASLMAQQASQDFKISKIDFAFQDSPNFGVGGYDKKVRKPGSWLEVEVTFDWLPRLQDPKYLDDLTVNYYILLTNKSTEQPKGALLTGSVSHVNVAQGKDLRSVVYVAPRVLEKLFGGKLPVNAAQTVAGVAVTLSSKGQVVAEKSTSGSGQWWTTYEPTTGLVLNKTETPFAPLAWDYHEAVKGGPGQ